MPVKTAISSQNVSRSKKRLIEHIENMPKLQFTSGDITAFIDGRPTYVMAWDEIKSEGAVQRVTVPKGTATGWKRRGSEAKH